MKRLYTQHDIDLLQKVDDEIIMSSHGKLINTRDEILDLTLSEEFYFSNSFIVSKNRETLVIYSKNFCELKQIEKSNLINISFFDNINNFILRYGLTDNQYEIYIDNLLIKSEEFIIGRLLNKNYRLHFRERFRPIQDFRCSDLLDEKTYWEYTCPPGLQASNTWVVRGEYLLFCENTDGSYQGNIKKIHLPTGELKWEAAVPMTRLHYNESQGLFISFWANVDYGQYYQIIDIDNETLEFGNPITDVILQNLPSTEGTLYLYERKLYFTDFSNAYGDQIPKIMFGCFDIDTKEVEFLQEVPEAKGDGFAQVIYSDNKLYLRSFGNKLYVYEHEITAS
jgi:hypothetical protein